MAKDQRDAGAQSEVRHEPIVSETLQENAAEHQAQAETAEATPRLDDSEDSPAKRHGDALQTGTGNRHGVHESGKRPDTCD